MSGSVVELTELEYKTLKEGFEAGAYGNHEWSGIHTPTWRKRIVPNRDLIFEGVLDADEIQWCGERIWGSYPAIGNSPASSPSHPMHTFREICLKVKGAAEIRVPTARSAPERSDG